MKVIGVIPARYASTRIPGKPLADIWGKPMIWWVYQQAGKVKEIDELVVATDDDRVIQVCDGYGIRTLMTSKEHTTPTSRIYEVSTRIEGDLYAFISGDEPLVNIDALSKVISDARTNGFEVTNAMSRIKTAPEVIDSANIKVVTGTRGTLLYTTRSPIPFPKGGLKFDYMKFTGISVYSKKALAFFHETPRSELEAIEECDLMRFIDKGIDVKMVEVECRNISVDTPKDLEMVRSIVKENFEIRAVHELNGCSYLMEGKQF